jgi:hypothetical protein
VISDAVEIALIVSAGPTIATVGGLIVALVKLHGVGAKVDTVKEQVGTVETKVDGRFSEMANELKSQATLILELTGSSEHAKAQFEATQAERDRPK